MIKKVLSYVGYREWKLVEMAVYVDITYRRFVCAVTGKTKEVYS